MRAWMVGSNTIAVEAAGRVVDDEGVSIVLKDCLEMRLAGTGTEIDGEVLYGSGVCMDLFAM